MQEGWREVRSKSGKPEQKPHTAVQIGNDGNLNQGSAGGDGEKEKEYKALCVVGICSRGT